MSRRSNSDGAVELEYEATKVEVLALFRARGWKTVKRVPAIHATGDGTHAMGLDVELMVVTDQETAQERMEVDITPALSSLARAAMPPTGGSWDVTCGSCGKDLDTVREAELLRRAVLVLAGRVGRHRRRRATMTLT